MAHLGELIAELRQDKGLTQKELNLVIFSVFPLEQFQTMKTVCTSRMLIRSLLLQTTFMSQLTTCSVAPHLISLSICCSKPSPPKRLLVM